MIGELPKSLQVNGHKYDIRTDYRDVLNIFQAINDPEMKDSEKTYVMLYILYSDFDQICTDDYQEAVNQAVRFIDGGTPEGSGSGSNNTKILDWEQDEQMIFSAINKVAGCETRNLPYLHWWSFLGFFNEIEEGLLSTVLLIRQKKSKKKPLEKWEREFYQKNKAIVDLKERLSPEEIVEREYYENLLK